MRTVIESCPRCWRPIRVRSLSNKQLADEMMRMPITTTPLCEICKYKIENSRWSRFKQWFKDLMTINPMIG